MQRARRAGAPLLAGAMAFVLPPLVAARGGAATSGETSGAAAVVVTGRPVAS